MTDVFVVITEVGDYDEKDKIIKYAGDNEKDAYKEAISKYPGSSDVIWVYFSIWRNGKQIAEIMRAPNSDRWSTNSGNVSEFQKVGIYFNSVGEEVCQISMKATMKIRNEIDKVRKKQCCTLEELNKTIAEIHQILYDEGYK